VLPTVDAVVDDAPVEAEVDESVVRLELDEHEPSSEAAKPTTTHRAVLRTPQGLVPPRRKIAAADLVEDGPQEQTDLLVRGSGPTASELAERAALPTSLVPDGAMVEVDPRSGVVRPL
jgi:hypothetical protein